MTDLPDIDQLLTRIRAEAQASDCGSILPEPLLPLAREQCHSQIQNPVAPALIDHLNDLLVIGDDAAFLQQAYLTLLQRPADTGGYQHFMTLLKDYGRPFALCALRQSPEGRAKNVKLPGFGLSLRFYQIWALLQRGRLGRLGRLPNLLYHHWRRLQLSFDTRLLHRFDSGQSRLSQELGKLNTSLEQLASDHSASLEQLASDHSASLEQLASDHSASLEQLASRTQTSSNEIAVLNSRVKMLQLLAQPIDPPQRTQTAEQLTPVSRTGIAERIDAFYLAFEEHMRGSQQVVSESLSGYLPDLSSLPESLLSLPVLDIGSGRGEWLKLLADRGLTAEGVEINPLMAGHARADGIEVHCLDAIDYLRGLADDSRVAISAFHVAEHLPFATLFALLEQAWRVLAPGGLLILETPNPENLLVGSHTFWHDFSHQRPLTPTALEFLVRFHGFSAVRLRRLHPYPAESRIASDTPLANRMSGHLYGPQDYAVLANKEVESGKIENRS